MLNKLRQLIKEGMIEKKNTGDGLRYQTFKNVLEKAQKTAKEARQEDNITDSMVIDAAKKEIKQLNDTLQYCKEGTDRFNETTKAIEIVGELLPKMASNDEVMKYLVESGQEKNMGKCMKALKEKFGDSLDGKSASTVVKDYIKQ